MALALKLKPVMQSKPEKKHQFEKLIYQIKGRNIAGYKLPTGETFELTDYTY